MVSIIVLNWNTLQDTLECLESVFAHTKALFELILIDNGSTDGSQAFFRLECSLVDDPRVTFVANSDNKGFAGGCNQGLALAKGDHICLLNSDTVVTEGWLEQMLASLERDPSAGIVGPLTDAPCIPRYQGSRRYAYGADDFRTMERLPFFCVLMARSIVLSVGPLDERFGLGNFEDDDYCRRIHALGYHSLVCGAAFVYHKVSRSFKANDVDVKTLHDHNLKLFHQKWNR